MKQKLEGWKTRLLGIAMLALVSYYRGEGIIGWDAWAFYVFMDAMLVTLHEAYIRHAKRHEAILKRIERQLSTRGRRR